MIDVIHRRSIRVSTEGGAGPYIMVPFSQLEEVRAQLTANNVRYWVDDEVLSLDGGPEIAVVNLGRDCNAAHVQELLDKIQ